MQREHLLRTGLQKQLLERVRTLLPGSVETGRRVCRLLHTPNSLLDSTRFRDNTLPGNSPCSTFPGCTLPIVFVPAPVNLAARRTNGKTTASNVGALCAHSLLSACLPAASVERAVRSGVPRQRQDTARPSNCHQVRPLPVQDRQRVDRQGVRRDARARRGGREFVYPVPVVRKC